MRANFAWNLNKPLNGRSLAMKCLKGQPSYRHRHVCAYGYVGSQRLLRARFNSQYFVQRVMMPLIQTVFPQRSTRHRLRLRVHLDNYSVHFSIVTDRFSLGISYCMFPTNLIVPT
jgi:hypothetical protein